MNIALLLGSFNPIHNGHLAIAHYVVDRRLADMVWFVVSPHNPLKPADELAPFEHRVAMVRLAIDAEPRFEVCDIERHMPRPSYTINTLRELQKHHPEHKFTILCGSDVYAQLDTWREPKAIREMVEFLVYPREGGSHSATMSDAPQFDLSATDLRTMISRQSTPKGLISSTVMQYIDSHGLYTKI